MRMDDPMRVAFLVMDGFEEVELTEPWKALRHAGVETKIVSPKSFTVRSYNYIEPGEWFSVDQRVDRVEYRQFDGLVIPGGVISIDHLRADKDSVLLVRSFVQSRKPVAAIGHAPWLLIESYCAAGRKLTASRTVRTDLADAGAHEINSPVVIDGNLLTSRGREDLPAFCGELVKMIADIPRIDVTARELEYLIP